MKWLKNNYINIILIYINILFIALAIIDAYQLINSDLPFIFLTITGGIAIYCIFNFVLSRAKDKKLIIFLFLILLIGTTLFFKRNIGEFIYDGIIKEIDTINSLLIERRPVDFAHFKNIFLVFIPIIAFAVMCLSTIGRLDYMLFIDIGVLTFLWALGYTITIEKSVLPFIILVGLTIGVNNHKRFMKSVGVMRIRHGVRSIRIVLPLLLITLIAAFITSNISYNTQGKYYTDFIQRFKDIFITSNGPGGGSEERRFSLKSSGYNDSSTTLGGSITINRQETLQVQSDKPLYLKGSSKDIYDGSSWGGTFGNGIKRNYFNVYVNVGKIDISHKSATDTQRISIKPLNSYRNLFVPIDTASIESDRVIYVNDRTKTAYFDNFNEDEYGIVYNEYTMPNDDVIEKSEYYKSIVTSAYRQELQLYNGITERTRNLVAELTEGASSDIDIVNTIEEYISDNYTYSLNVSPIPEGRDFVDYYLFESPRGYCVYSASAVTIMLRIAGIPARYVEGFKTSESSYEDGVYNVTNADAHAWTEAYIFDGVSYRWITVDASTTPAELQEEQDNDESGNNNTDNPNTPEGNENNTPGQGSVVDPGIENPVFEEDTSQEKNARSRVPAVLVYSFIGVIGIVLLGRVFYKIIIIFYTINSGNNKSLYGYFIKRLRRHGYKKDKGMTDREFIHSLDKKELMITMSNLLDMVYAEHYGGLSIKVDKKELYKDIEGSIKKAYGKGFRYYLFKYLL